MDLMEARVGAIGHSHVALWFHRAADGELTGAQAGAGAEQDVSEGKWLSTPAEWASRAMVTHGRRGSC